MEYRHVYRSDPLFYLRNWRGTKTLKNVQKGKGGGRASYKQRERLFIRLIAIFLYANIH